MVDNKHLISDNFKNGASSTIQRGLLDYLAIPDVEQFEVSHQIDMKGYVLRESEQVLTHGSEGSDINLRRPEEFILNSDEIDGIRYSPRIDWKLKGDDTPSGV